MQKNLNAAKRCREESIEFGESDIYPTLVGEAPLTYKKAFNSTKPVTAELPAAAWPLLNVAKTGNMQKSTGVRSERGIDKKVENQSQALALLTKEAYRQTFAEALKAKKKARAPRQQHKIPNLRHRTPQNNTNDLQAICVKKHGA